MAEIKVKNIYYMLSYAYQTLHETGLDDVGSEDFDNIHDLFAAILARGVGAQIKRGLYRNYLQHEESLAGVRGQIRVTETIKQQTQSQGRLLCVFDEFSPSSPHNQVLKCVMGLLLRHGNVKQDNKKALRRVLNYFTDVIDIEPTTIRWDVLKYHRNNASYRMLIGICRLTVRGLLLTTESGTHRLSSWLQGEELHRLYEKFVLSYYITHHNEWKPKAADIKWDTDIEEHSPYLPVMKSDITLQNGDKRLIIDTKCYEHSMQYHGLHGSLKYISSHLYQVYAYVKNSDKKQSGNVAGVLLYAKTDEPITPDEDIVISGNRISLKTLDLNSDWNVITTQLEKLCDWLTCA